MADMPKEVREVSQMLRGAESVLKICSVSPITAELSDVTCLFFSLLCIKTTTDHGQADHVGDDALGAHVQR